MIDYFPLADSLSSIISHLLKHLGLLNKPHSHNTVLNQKYSLSSHHPLLLFYRLKINHLQVLLQSEMNNAFKCISKLPQLRTLSVYPKLHNDCIHVYPIMASNHIS